MNDTAVKKDKRAEASTRKIGAKGERLARRYLKKNGYKILEKNYKAMHGEIDIVAWDKEQKRTVFVEVKSRKDSKELIERYGRAANAVTSQKKARLLTAIQAYIWKNPQAKDCRIDIIEVYFPSESRSRPRIEHIRSAFGREAFSYNPSKKYR